MPSPPQLTIRQQLLALLAEDWYSARDLAHLIGISERDVEFHLTHVRQSVGSHSHRFVIDQAQCRQCGFQFRERTRLTRPSRCPRCRSEDLSSPRFRVILAHTGKK